MLFALQLLLPMTNCCLVLCPPTNSTRQIGSGKRTAARRGLVGIPGSSGRIRDTKDASLSRGFAGRDEPLSANSNHRAYDNGGSSVSNTRRAHLQGQAGTG